ncbi:MAG: hypothetical protein J7502_07740 [Flavisolibacter sp.]|nr:hypothetical protein [Flavisolibacter sp.]
MKAYLSLSMLFLIVLINACNNEKTEKQTKDQPTVKDTVVAVEKLPSIEKEFDTMNIKPAEESVLLKFNFQKGKTYNYTMSFDVSQKRGDQLRGSTMKWNYDMQVIGEKAGLKTLKTTYKRIDMTMNMGNDQKMEFSSEKEIEAMDFMQLPSRMFKIVKGKSFTMQVNEKGEVVSVTGFDKIGEAVVSEAGLPEEMKPMLRQNFQQRFNDDAVKQMFTQTFEIFPNKPVKIGDSWKTNTNIMKQEVSTVYTVKNIKDNRVFLTGTSKIKSDDGKNQGTQTSKLIIDTKTGLMLDGAFDQKSEDGNSTTKSRIVGKEL